jgi:rod shape-determining protein MreC
MKNLFTFLWKYQFFFLFALLEVFCVFLFVKNSSYQGSVILNSTNGITGNILNSYSNITGYFSLRKANRILAEENAEFYNKLPGSFIKTDTNTFFYNDTLYMQQYKYVAAKVISNSTNKRNNYLKLNKGIVQGIDKEMAVITPDGIVGQVIEVSDHFCSVMSVLNVHSMISVKLKSSKQVGTLIWNGENYRIGTMTDIPSHTRLTIGDTVITSGFSHIFPEGVNIGTIDDFSIRPGDNFFTAKIKYAVDYNKVFYVTVVKNLQQDEIFELDEAESKY